MQESFLKNRFFKADKYILSLWFLLPVIYWSIDFFKDRYNNYKIFKGTFWHLIHQQNLYATYPTEYGDTNHYGPLFGILMAPFAILPDIYGCLLWGIGNIAILYYALQRLNLKIEYRIFLMLFTLIEVANSTWSNQFNPSVIAFFIFTYSLVKQNKTFWAPLWIMLSAFIKIYGILGLLFFFFTKEKHKFIWGCIVWSVVFFVSPMIFSSPGFILQSYSDWYYSLAEKNQLNIALTSSQDISIMGLARRLTGNGSIPSWPFLIAGSLLVVAPLYRFDQYKNEGFQLMFLASILMFIVLFSTGSEHPTYVICVTGIGLWLMMEKKILTVRNSIIIFFIIMWTGLAPTDLYSVPVRKFFNVHSLKAIPCIVVWFIVIKDLLTRDFSTVTQLFNERSSL